MKQVAFSDFNPKRKKFSGFTLVELIVVITILVILGTIAFLNLGNFSGSARDATRISDLTNISKGLDLAFIKNWRVPSPEAGTNAGVISLLASWSVVGYQWAIGSNILSQIKMGWDGKDPLDKKSYTYVVNSNSTKYQILGLAEDMGSVAVSSDSILGLDRAYAGYDARYPISRGSTLGVLLGNSGTTINQPIQENYGASFTGVEIFTATGGLYRVVLTSKSSLTGTGPVLWEIVGRLDASVGTYPGCDTPNIKLPNGQVWAACNVGATNAWAGQGSLTAWCTNGMSTDCLSSLRYTVGSYYQWGRNKDVTAGATTIWPVASDMTSNFITNNLGGAPGANVDWLTDAAQNNNLWWGSGTTSTTGTYTSQWSPAAMQWPCPSGYHVPTQYEWWLSLSTINSGLTNTPSWQDDTSVATTLKLPLSGFRSFSTGNYYNQGIDGHYWSSSTSGLYGYDAYISNTRVYPPNRDYRTYGFTVRCLKN